MKDFITNKSDVILTTIYKLGMYLCWFLFALSFIAFIKDDITNGKIILLVLSLILINGARNFFKYLYRLIAPNTYHKIKHDVEMKYFKKTLSLDYKDIEEKDLNDISNRILSVSYKFTKFVREAGEGIIPCLIGLIIMFTVLAEVNGLIAVFMMLLLFALLYYKYTKSNEFTVNNYNDLLKDFVNKLFTIKVLNLGEYAYNKLDKNEDNDIALLSSDTEENDLIFSNGLLLILGLTLIFIILFVNVTTNKLGIIIFFTIMAIKMRFLINKIVPTIKNYLSLRNEINELDNLLVEKESIKYNKNWKTISVKDGLVKYKSGVTIKIPSFALNAGDTISIMGKSGQGKSTIINVLSGISSLDQGSMAFDGSITNENVDAVYISKDTKLFNMSLKDNLKLDKEITEEELMDYIKEVNLLDWYNQLDKGLDSIIDNNICDEILLKLNLIRGLIMEKEIYFLDDPTDGMDLDSEKQIVSVVKKALKKKTLIIVTQRPILTNICKKHYFIKDHTLLESEPLL